ncbi:MAG: hypothetical protein AAFQ73_05025, partial [Pseudomonadota bacterium]
AFGGCIRRATLFMKLDGSSFASSGAPEKTPPEKPPAAETTPDQSPARKEDAQDPENALSPLQRLAARFSRRT